MKRLLVVFALVVVGVVGLGFYLGWFRLSTDSGDQKTSITVTVDQDRIQEDKGKAKEKVEDVGRKIKEKTHTPERAGRKLMRVCSERKSACPSQTTI